MGTWKNLSIEAGTGGWKELYREAGTGGWKELTWESVAVDIGGAAINRNTHSSGDYTRITKVNPANANGTLTEIELWMFTTGVVHVGIFYVVSGNTLKCRSAVNLGSVTAGSKQTKNVNLAVQTGDYIGYICVTGAIEVSDNTGSGLWYVAGNKCVVDNESLYTYWSGTATISLYGKS